MTQAHFTMVRKIRFGDTDPAGIVFYPRYFEMFVEVVEDFFAETLGFPFKRLHLDAGIAIPLVKVEAEFLRPSRIGDELALGLTLLAFGRSSFTMRIEAASAEEERLRATLVMVFMSMQAARPVAPPAEIAAILTGLLDRQAADAGAATHE